jgi:hypothetical protein
MALPNVPAHTMPVLRYTDHMILAVRNAVAAAFYASIQPLYAPIPRDPMPSKGEVARATPDNRQGMKCGHRVGLRGEVA